MNLYSKTTLLYMSILLLTVRLASAEDSFLKQHHEALAKNPTGVTFTIEITNGKTQFNIGEIIPITLSFSSSVPDTYELSIREGDRSGRLHLDTFISSPAEGVTDPLYFFYNSGIGFISGGLSSGPVILSENPHSLHIQINEWLRFDKPDTYSLYISSHRTTKLREKPDELGRWNEMIPLISNILQFEVLPRNPAWETETLKSIRQDMQSNEVFRTQHSKKYNAYRKLRFLGSEKSIDTLIDGLMKGERFSNNQWQCQAGLIGHPNQELVLRKMEKRFQRKDSSINDRYLRTMATIAFGLQNPEPLPPYPKEDIEKQKTYQDMRKKRLESFESIGSNYALQLVKSAENKDSSTRAETMLTAYDTFRHKHKDEWTKEQKELAQNLPGVIASSFKQFTPERIQHIIERNKDILTVPEMLPLYRKLFNHPPYVESGETKDIADIAVTGQRK